MIVPLADPAGKKSAISVAAHERGSITGAAQI
jgi:hypothetical protein